MIVIHGFQIHVYWVCGGLFLLYILGIVLFIDIGISRATNNPDNK